jgi:hypothetical protein
MSIQNSALRLYSEQFIQKFRSNGTVLTMAMVNDRLSISLTETFELSRHISIGQFIIVA